VAIIDGVHGNHSERMDEVTQLFAPEEVRLYKRLKEAYNDEENEISKELRQDMAIYK